MLSFLKRAPASAGRMGVYLSQAGIAVVHIEDGKERARLTACAFRRYDNDLAPSAQLAGLVRELGLVRPPVSAVARPGDYQLVMVEAPQVQPAELRAAVRWRLGDLIDFNVEDAVVDVFDLPPQSRRGQQLSMYAVAARRVAVQEIVDTVSAGAPGLDVIDVPELCLRNLAIHLPQDAVGGVALLALDEDHAELVLTRHTQLYLARRIEFPRAMDLGDGPATRGGPDPEAVALELQRSIDYYERHFDQPPIADLIIAPATERAQRLAEGLRRETGLRVATLDLGAVLDLPAGLDVEMAGQCLLAIGAALRTEKTSL